MRPTIICCEQGCSCPVDLSISKVRCPEHYTPPRYGGHGNTRRKTPTKKRKSS